MSKEEHDSIMKQVQDKVIKLCFLVEKLEQSLNEGLNSNK
jgi:hypothetical protein